MISTFNLKKLLSSFILSRGLVETEEGFSWTNSLLVDSKDTSLETHHQKVLLFFKLRGYSFNPDSSDRYLVDGIPKIAGIQYYNNQKIVSSMIDLLYCTRFKDLEDDGTHFPGFFMLGIHKEISSGEEEILFHFETVLDFLKEKGINRLIWDTWSDGRNKGPCIEFYHQDLEIGNLVFITENEEKLLENPIIDLGIGWERYCKLMNVNLPSRAVLITLVSALAVINNLKPGRRGLEDNIKRVFRITPFDNLEENLEKALTYWRNNTLEDLQPSFSLILAKLKRIKEILNRDSLKKD